MQLSGVASPNGDVQDALHGGEVGNLRPHVGQVSRRDLAHLGADTVAVRGRSPSRARTSSSVKPSSRARRTNTRRLISSGR
jgi:hypothetical protein